MSNRAKGEMLDSVMVDFKSVAGSKLKEYSANWDIVIGRTASDRRFIANTPPDRALLEPMTEQEMIGTRGHVAHDAASGINTFTPD